MDASINSFLNEINEIAPETHNSEDAKDWQQCFDELTGYSYYWNTKTDKVTWVEPKLFKKENVTNTKHQNNPSGRSVTNRKPNMPPIAPLFPNAALNPDAKVKIYSLQETLENKSQNKNVNFCCKKKRHSSDDEKIELITEFSNDNDSEMESKPSRNVNGDNRELDCSNHSDDDDDDDDDDVDLLVKIQQKAQELQHLGGKVPAEVKTTIQVDPPQHEKKPLKHVSAISLVAGYHSSDSEVDDEQDTSPSKFNILPSHPVPNVEKSHSTLFPITEPINVNDFISTNNEPEKDLKEVPVVDTNTFDSKAFQRKRRIGVSLVNNSKKVKTDTELPSIEHDETEQQGPKSTSSENNLDTVKYPGFQKGGIMFLKGDTVNPTEEKINTDNPLKEDDSNMYRDKTVSNYNILKEKLKFLCEGRSPILPVQAMLIQAETLFMAMEAKCLKMSYLYNWLEENCSELTNLEKDAAPDGWLLQWDRSNKRYFYLNHTTGESQWEYPQSDITRCDDAMDISTTPPPPQLEEPSAHESQRNFGPQLPVDPPLPPSPPKISSPTPPPAPMISKELKKTHLSDVSLPPEQPLPSIPMPPENYEPLPPGVDSSDVAALYKNSSEAKTVHNESLNSVLDSFYSEIAEVSEREKPELVSVSQQSTTDKDVIKSQDLEVHLIGEQARKKKKKVKLAQGLTMKKKGVSELVEKWKSVQKSYGN